MRRLGASMLDTMQLLDHGVIIWPDGKMLMRHGEGYLLRTRECEICFRWYGDVESYLAFNEASFQHYVVDAEDARQQRIESKLRASRL